MHTLKEKKMNLYNHILHFFGNTLRVEDEALVNKAIDALLSVQSFTQKIPMFDYEKPQEEYLPLLFLAIEDLQSLFTELGSRQGTLLRYRQE